MEKEEEDEQHPHTISNTPSPFPSMDNSSPPPSHHERTYFSPTADLDNSSPTPSHHERTYFSPTADSITDSPVPSDRISREFFSPREHKYSFPPPETISSIAPVKPLSPDTTVKRSVSDEPVVAVMKADPGAGAGITGGVMEEGTGGGRKMRTQLSILRRTKRERMVKRTALWFRVCGFVLCMISFSIMAADKNQGWTIDSFDRYKEFRYCLSVNVIGFVYSGVQACDLLYHLTAETYVVGHNLRYHFDFFMDQALTYLLISASSSAATRVEDWESNWGKDKFPNMAKASVVMSFLAFVSFSFSSLISGYTLSTLKST